MPKIIRVGEYKNFTIMENDFLRDMLLDIPERGLLATMLSLPEDWDFSGIGLTSILPCGKTKVFNTLKKLEKAGYLKRNRIYVDGKVADWEYLICGRPVFRDGYSEDNSDCVSSNGKDTVSSAAKGKKTAADKAKKTVENSVKAEDDCSVLSENLVPDNLFPENQEVGFQEVENREDNKIYNKKILNNQVCNNQSINQSNNGRAEIDGLIDSNTDAEKYKAYEELIKRNIEYDILKTRYGIGDREILDEIVAIMAETVAFNHNYIKINGNDMPAEIVKSRFLKIDSQDIEYIISTFSKNTSKIYNIRSYLLSTIYNAKNTINSYYQAEVRHDFYE